MGCLTWGEDKENTGMEERTRDSQATLKTGEHLKKTIRIKRILKCLAYGTESSMHPALPFLLIPTSHERRKERVRKKRKLSWKQPEGRD